MCCAPSGHMVLMMGLDELNNNRLKSWNNGSLFLSKKPLMLYTTSPA